MEGSPLNKIENQKGLTLLEVLVSVTIAGVVFVVLLSGFGTNIKTTGTAEDYTTASFLARDIMTKLELQKEIKAGKEQGDFGKDFPNYRWSTEIEKDTTLPYYRVTAKVIFTRGGNERDLSVKTILLEQPKKDEK